MGTHSQANLNDLILSARAGDQRAFEELLKAYSPLIESLVSAYVRTLEETDSREDLRQEACIAFYNAVEHFDVAQEDVQFGLYAKTCMRNRLISCVRSARSRNAFVSLPTEAEATDDAFDPAQSLLEEERYRELYHRVESTLSHYESRIWWLYLSGRTAKEVAEILETSERSVQNAIYRIRKKLRTHIPNP